VSKMKRRINKEKRRDRLLKLVEIWGLSPRRFMQQQTPGPNPQHGLGGYGMDVGGGQATTHNGQHHLVRHMPCLPKETNMNMVEV
jgi:hypothetical protein